MVEEKQIQSPKEEKKEEKNAGMAIAAYLLFFIPLLTEARKDPFVRYHIKQGLVLFISVFILCVLSFIPVAGLVIFLFGSIVLFVLWLIGILNAAQGKKEPLPLVGKFGEKIDL